MIEILIFETKKNNTLIYFILTIHKNNLKIINL